MINLSKRMQVLIDLIAGDAYPADVLADVGTDHGFVPIALCENDVISSAIAMDLREGPLSRAAEHVKEANLTDRIELRLSDGLEKLSENEADIILIAGMGGELIQRILEEKPTVARSARRLILQPQSKLLECRRFLSESGYVFLKERAVSEKDKTYFIMEVCAKEAVGDRECFIPEDDGDLAFGGLLLRQKDPVLKAYLKKEKALWDKHLSGLPTDASDADPRTVQRRDEIIAMQKQIEHALLTYF